MVRFIFSQYGFSFGVGVSKRNPRTQEDFYGHTVAAVENPDGEGWSVAYGQAAQRSTFRMYEEPIIIGEHDDFELKIAVELKSRFRGEGLTEAEAEQLAAGLKAALEGAGYLTNPPPPPLP